MSREKNLLQVIQSGMCVGCGACACADPSVHLEFDHDRMMFAPDGAGNETAASVCPAVEVDFEDLHQKVFPGAAVDEHGVVDSVLLAQSCDYDRNFKASSGGMIKEILIEFLSRDDVDGAIALKQVEGLHFEPCLLRSPEEVDELPGSIYHNLSLENAIRLLQENEGRFVLVAIPCQLEGIYKYIFSCAPELRQKIYATVGIICGWNYSHHALRAVMEFKGHQYEDIQDISYRGGGPVGKLKVQTPTDTLAINRRVDFSYQVAFDRSFNIRRCHVCVNHCNYLADLVVGDAWLPSTVGTKTGISIVISRTAAMTSFMKGLEAQAKVRLITATKDEITESQSRNITFGDFAYSYAEYLREHGEFVPDVRGPNRAIAKLASKDIVERFHLETSYKQELQRQGRYRRLWWRKLTVELGRFSMKYIRWFFVRVLKVKSLFGIRKEIPVEKLASFK